MSVSGCVHLVHARTWAEEGKGAEREREGGYRIDVLSDWGLVPDGAGGQCFAASLFTCAPPGDCLARHGLRIDQLNQRCVIEDAKRETLRGSQGSPEDLESVIQ